MIKQNKYNETLVAHIEAANQFYEQMAMYYAAHQSLLDSIKTDVVSAEYKTIDYCNGSYTGFTFNEMPWGEGTYTSKSGSKVYAEFYDHHAIVANATIEGDKLYSGELIAASGKMCLNGYGKLVSSEMTIEGDFAFDILHGKAKIAYHNTGEIFVGIYVYGERNGLGRLTRKDGSYVEGRWDNERCSSFAKLGFADGSIFTGIQFEGKPRLGKLEYANGDIYEGAFHVSGVPMGDGQLIVAKTKNILTGFFWRHGISSGLLKSPDGTITKVVSAEKYNCMLPESYYLTCNKAIDDGSQPQDEVDKFRINI